MRLRPAVFIDKDGTLVNDVPYNVDPDRIVLTPGAGPALRALRDAGFVLVLVSNQSGIALGRFPESALRGVEERLSQLLAPHGVSLDAAYYCPHAPGGEGRPACSCRKPAPGLFFRAARERQLHLRRSWMIGDILNDVEAGRAAGCQTILLDNGGETEWKVSPARTPHYTAGTLAEAAEIILAHEAGSEDPASTAGLKTRPTPGLKTHPTPGPKTRPTPGPKTRPTPGLKTRPTPGPKTRPTPGLGTRSAGNSAAVLSSGGTVVAGMADGRPE